MGFLIVVGILLLGYFVVRYISKIVSMKCYECDTMMVVDGEPKPNWTRLICPKCGNTRFLIHNVH